jgi:hypothetical protein
MNALCLVIDRLHVGYLGAYGNAWCQTPSLDRLASQATVFDHALIDSPDLDALYRSYWHGRHALCADGPPALRPALAEQLGEAGVTTILMSDEPQVIRNPCAIDFDELIEVEPAWEAETAGTIEQTQLARCFMRLIQRIESAREPFFLWCHLASLGATWDAPLNFREAYVEPGDPPPPTWAEVPNCIHPADDDPDVLLGVSQSYAGQVTLLDTCLGALLECLESAPAGRDTLLTLVSLRGFPLGEHRRLGPCDDALFSELIHVPWMMRFPDGLAAAARSQQLIEPADLWASLLDWWKIAPQQSPTACSLLPLARQEPAIERDRLCIRGRGAERAIRTPAWYLRVADEPQLFVKPDDRWEVNNVTPRCQEVSECLLHALSQCQQALGQATTPGNRVADLPPLSDVLLHGLD